MRRCNVLVAARDAGVRRLVYAGSSSAYGDLATLPKREDMPTAPLSPYALQKLVGEQYVRMFTALYGLETVTTRYFNVFGPRQDPSSPYSGVISLFIRAIHENRAPTIYGDGEQTRDFTYVANVVDGVLRACDRAGRVRAGDQRRHRRADLAQRAVRDAARADGIGRSRRCTPPRAPATSAIRRPTSHWPNASSAIVQSSRWRKGCGARWTGIARRQPRRRSDVARIRPSFSHSSSPARSLCQFLTQTTRSFIGFPSSVCVCESDRAPREPRQKEGRVWD